MAQANLSVLSTASLANGTPAAAVGGPVITSGMLASSQAFRVQSTSDPGLTILKFPSDTPMYYMTIGINKYSRQSWRAVGELTLEGLINLSLPNALIDNHNVVYDPEPLGLLGVGWEAVSGNSNLDTIEQQLENNKALLTGTAAVVAGSVLGNAGKNIKNAVLAAAGLAVNNFLTVMLKGPDYKKRSFTWKFSPNTREETEQLRQIGVLLNDSMAPSLATGVGSAFFRWPKIFTVQFRYLTGDDVGKYTFRMKPMVLTGASFNYTGSGQPIFFGPTHAPQVIEVHLEFLELEYWLAGDFQAAANTPGAAGTANFVP